MVIQNLIEKKRWKINSCTVAENYGEWQFSCCTEFLLELITERRERKNQNKGIMWSTEMYIGIYR